MVGGSYTRIDDDVEPASPFRNYARKGTYAVILALGVVGMTAIFKSQSATITTFETAFKEQKSTHVSNTLSGSQPHIVLFTMDDLGWNDFGFHSTDIPKASPFMNTLVGRSIKLSNYYTQPSCTPSRSTIMSGKYVHKTGYQNMEIQYDYSLGMPLKHKLMPQYLSELGYETHGFGKWNIGHCNEKYMPHMRGFNHFLGYFCPGHGYRDYICGLEAGVKDMYEGFNDEMSGQTWSTGAKYQGIYDTELYRDYSSHVIRRHAKVHGNETSNHVPLFMWVAHHAAHGTYDSAPNPPETLLTAENQEYIALLRERENEDAESGKAKFFEKRLITATLIMSVDNALRDLVGALVETGLMNNTLLVVNSDNGGDPNYAVGHPGNNFPLRSEKFYYFEGAVRVPAFIYAPGIIPSDLEGTTFSGMMHHVDLLPTFVGLSNSSLITTDDELDGFDMLPSIIYGKENPRTEIVFTLPREKSWRLGQTKTTEALAIRVGDYKLLINSPNDGWYRPSVLNESVGWYLNTYCTYDWFSVESSDGILCGWSHWLFNVKTDPYEKHNLFEHPEFSEVKETLLNRAYEIMDHDYGDESSYGAKMYEQYMKTSNDVNESDAMETSFRKHNYWVVPWECEVLK